MYTLMHTFVTRLVLPRIDVEVHVVARDDRELRALLFSPLLAQPTDETAAHGMRRAACTATELVVDTPVLKTVAKATMATATLAPGTKS